MGWGGEGGVVQSLRNKPENAKNDETLHDSRVTTRKYNTFSCGGGDDIFYHIQSPGKKHVKALVFFAFWVDSADKFVTKYPCDEMSKNKLDIIVAKCPCDEMSRN